MAKKFFRLSVSETNSDSFDNADSVSIVANRKEIEGEAIRLSQGRWFLDAFFRFCKTQPDVSIDASKQIGHGIAVLHNLTSFAQ